MRIAPCAGTCAEGPVIRLRKNGEDREVDTSVLRLHLPPGGLFGRGEIGTDVFFRVIDGQGQDVTETATMIVFYPEHAGIKFYLPCLDVDREYPALVYQHNKLIL